MKSVAFEPLDLSRKRATSFNIKDITGNRQIPAVNSSMRALSFSQSPSPSRSSLEPDQPFLSPETGQHDTAVSKHVESNIDSDMRELLETYEVVEKGFAMPPNTAPQGISEATSHIAGSPAIDLGYVSKNISWFQVDNGLSKSCPEHVVEPPGSDQPDSYDLQ